MKGKYVLPRYFIVVSIILILAGVLSYVLAHSTWIISYCQIDEMITEHTKQIEDLYAKDGVSNRQGKIKKILGDIFTDFSARYPLKNLLGHLSIAFAVAFILMITVEIYIRKKALEELGEDVLFAVLKMQIPDVVFIEIQDHILRQPLYRKNWGYDFTFKGRPYDDLDRNMIVYECTLTWTIQNISSQKVEYNPFVSIFDHPKAIVHDNDNGNVIHLSRHLGIWVDNDPLLKLDEIFKQEEREREKNKETISLKVKPIILGPGDEKTIRVAKEEVAYHPSVSVCAMAGYGENLKVTTHNEARGIIKNIRVTFLHPRSERLKHKPGTRDWVYKGGLLPNQGINVSWDAI